MVQFLLYLADRFTHGTSLVSLIDATVLKYERKKEEIHSRVADLPEPYYYRNLFEQTFSDKAQDYRVNHDLPKSPAMLELRQRWQLRSEALDDLDALLSPFDAKKNIFNIFTRFPQNYSLPAVFGDADPPRLVKAPIPYETLYQHTHIIGGAGAGKTQLLSSIIIDLIHDPKKPTVVVVDSQGDLISELVRLPVHDRMIYISPNDNPAINIFDVQSGDEQVIAGAIQALNYFFTEVADLALTSKQGVALRYMARLAVNIPNVTLYDLLAMLDDTSLYSKYINQLPPAQKDFFTKDFNGKQFKETKEQIRYRFQAILENPAIADLFTSPKTKLNLFDALQQGSIILIDTNKAYLKDASGNYGKVFIALILQAILERATIPANRRRPMFLIVDEAHEYFGDTTDDLLTEVRKYKCGCFLAHQYLGQGTSKLQSSLATNTACKLASQVSLSDARKLAGDMHCEPEFITCLSNLEFACYVRGTGTQISKVEYGRLENAPKVDNQEFLRRNRERIAAPEPIEVPDDDQTDDETDAPW